MGSGLIFAILVVGWLAFLISWLVQRKDPVVDEDENTDRFSESMRIIRRSADPFTDEPDPELEVSTPLTRAAGLHEIRQSQVLAARRRRHVVLVMFAALVACLALVIAQPLPIDIGWWVPLVPGALLVAFLVIARYSVVTLNRVLDARMQRVCNGWDEPTTSFEVPAELREPESEEYSIELTGPVNAARSVWDPLPVTSPTYVSKPMVARTVRTIDLAMPVTAATSRVPVTAEVPDAEVGETEAIVSGDPNQAQTLDDRPRAVGE